MNFLNETLTILNNLDHPITNLDLNPSTIIWVCLCVIVCIILLYWVYRRYAHQERNHPHHVPIHFPDVQMMFFEQEDLEGDLHRIPLEDRVDLDLEDRHNVHNTTLKRNAQQVINSLKVSDQKKYTIDTALIEIRKMIEFNLDPDLDKLDRALFVLDKIEEMDSTYQCVNLKELEILRLVWERINHPINQKQVIQLKQNLIDQLADCGYGSNSIHCCEGRIMRLLQTLEQCDVENIVDLRPLWAYKEEISNKITHYKDKLLKKTPEIYQELEKKLDLTPEDINLIKKFNRCLIRNLDQRFEIDYVSKKLLTKDELDDLTKPYYDSLNDF